jgi:hypothetical protein
MTASSIRRVPRPMLNLQVASTEKDQREIGQELLRRATLPRFKRQPTEESKKRNRPDFRRGRFSVQRRGLEPPSQLRRQHLKLVCLPVPPPLRRGSHRKVRGCTSGAGEAARRMRSEGHDAGAIARFLHQLAGFIRAFLRASTPRRRRPSPGRRGWPLAPPASPARRFAGVCGAGATAAGAGRCRRW